MTPEIQMILTIVFPTLGAIATILAIKRNSKQDAKDEGKNSGVILTEMGYIKSGIDDIKRKQERTDTQYTELHSKTVANESSAKQAHRRIDDLIASLNNK